MDEDCCSDSWPKGRITEAARRVLEQGTFRETFLAGIANPRDREVVRASGIVHHKAYLSSDQIWPRKKESTSLSFEAVLADLRFLKEYVAELVCSEERARKATRRGRGASPGSSLNREALAELKVFRDAAEKEE
jgi:hypothetical protein